MNGRGFTVIELLVVIGISAILTAGISRAYIESINFDQRVRSGRAEEQQIRDFQNRMAQWIRTAYVSSLPDDTASCFIGDIGQGGPAGSGSSATTLTFTALGPRLPSRLASSTEEDWETIHESFGPQGGIAEVSYSTVPVGQPTGEAEGLFQRTQRPADGDPTQGGYEQSINPDVSEISFEFFDGLSWQQNWDTRTMGTRRIPAAVRVTYRLAEEDRERVFVIRLPHSDVTPENPVGEAG